jgi:hypothetical protein
MRLAFLLALLPACVAGPVQGRRLQPSADPALSYFTGSRICLVSGVAAVVLDCRVDMQLWEARFDATLPRTFPMEIVEGHLYDGDFRRQPWLAPPAGPPSPCAAPVGRRIEPSGQVVLVRVDQPLRTPGAQVEVTLPTLRLEGLELLFEHPLRLPFRVAAP